MSVIGEISSCREGILNAVKLLSGAVPVPFMQKEPAEIDSLQFLKSPANFLLLTGFYLVTIATVF